MIDKQHPESAGSSGRLSTLLPRASPKRPDRLPQSDSVPSPTRTNPQSTTSTPFQRARTERRPLSRPEQPAINSGTTQNTRPQEINQPPRSPSNAVPVPPQNTGTAPSQPKPRRQSLMIQRLAATFETPQQSARVPSPASEDARLTISRSESNLAKKAEGFGPLIRKFSGSTASGGSPSSIGEYKNGRLSFERQQSSTLNSPSNHQLPTPQSNRQPSPGANPGKRLSTSKRARSSTQLSGIQEHPRVKIQKGRWTDHS